MIKLRKDNIDFNKQSAIFSFLSLTWNHYQHTIQLLRGQEDCMGTAHFQSGLDKLAQPILPLIRLVQLLFLASPFTSVGELAADLPATIETGSCSYDEPQKLLAPYLEMMAELQRLKEPRAAAYRIIDERHAEIEAFEALDLWLAHAVLVRELETINSLLCGPCGCGLCCIGPEETDRQQFFEIPLRENEQDLFDIPHFDSEASRRQTPYHEPPLRLGKAAFYQSAPAVYRWQTGWSMILPRHSSCQHLTRAKTCTIYPERPEVCRRPPIFSYLLERVPEQDQKQDNTLIPAYLAPKKLLAVWDCPFVRKFQQEIGAYAEICGLTPIFKENKA